MKRGFRFVFVLFDLHFCFLLDAAYGVIPVWAEMVTDKEYSQSNGRSSGSVRIAVYARKTPEKLRIAPDRFRLPSRFRRSTLEGKRDWDSAPAIPRL